MSEKEFLGQLAAQIKSVPDKIAIPEVQAFSADASQKKAETFLKKFDALKIAATAKFDKIQSRERTLYRLANNARLETHHLSGALRFFSGIAPMEELFDKVHDRKVLTSQIEAVAKQVDLAQWAGRNESIEFERLWQIKAAAVDKDGTESGQVLCRSVGAYRHFVDKFPVLGAASVSIRLTGTQVIDHFQLNARQTSSKSLGTEKVITPEESARRLYRQLVALAGRGSGPVYEMTTAESVRFGYMASPRRLRQEFLVPIVAAVVTVQSKDFSQGYVLVTPATDNPKLVPNLRPATTSGAVKTR